MLSYLEGKCQAEDNTSAGWENWAAGGFCVALSAKAPGLAASMLHVDRQGTGPPGPASAGGHRPGRIREPAATVGLAEVSSSWQWWCICRPASQSAGSNLGGLVWLGSCS